MRVAKKDIHVVKFLINVGGVYKTPYREMVVDINEPIVADCLGEPVDDSVGDFLSLWTINNGIHSYSTRCLMGVNGIRLYVNSPVDRLFLDYWDISCDVRFMDCIIPKGTKYYLNEVGEYVSEQLVVKKEVDNIFSVILTNDTKMKMFRTIYNFND